ncbi:PREDICTED: uncharacterized protein LOC102863381 [Elephantulus edwardii]|uniref:uncharacterized protein LOC102863381 n=1 Tax=Elephantulus edwardii TaxID=28737 RepID=UPI0003F0D8D0|nr:PREDICTED: uncharacterized protein LOC102863381 [Elephantulus edwardii]
MPWAQPPASSSTWQGGAHTVVQHQALVLPGTRTKPKRVLLPLKARWGTGYGGLPTGQTDPNSPVNSRGWKLTTSAFSLRVAADSQPFREEPEPSCGAGGRPERGAAVSAREGRRGSRCGYRVIRSYTNRFYRGFAAVKCHSANSDSLQPHGQWTRTVSDLRHRQHHSVTPKPSAAVTVPSDESIENQIQASSCIKRRNTYSHHQPL